MALGASWSDKSKLAVLFAAIISPRNVSSCSERWVSDTCMRFCVRVPVLSVQITEAAPIVSQECIVRGSVCSRISCRMLKAKLRVTLMGRPSGTATTMSVTATMMVWRK